MNQTDGMRKQRNKTVNNKNTVIVTVFPNYLNSYGHSKKKCLHYYSEIKVFAKESF